MGVDLFGQMDEYTGRNGQPIRCSSLVPKDEHLKKYSGSLLINVARLKHIWCIPAVNHPLYENVRADNEANKPVDFE
jgi:hypothetical protein